MALEQGRLDVITRRQAALELLHRAASKQFSAFLFGDFQIGKDLVELLLGRLGADHGVGVQRIAALDLVDLLQHFSHERRVDRLLNQSSRWAGAHFALVEERQHQAFGGFFNKTGLSLHDVFKEDIRRLAAQLYRRRNDVLGSTFHDVRAHWGRTGESDLGNALAGGQCLTGFTAETMHDIEHARRQ
ncbi:hypothetical protein D3C79_723150 [compost metagenome]